MQFTPDGYVEPLPPRPAGLAIGAVLVIGGLASSFTVSVCLGLTLILVGVLFAVNEGGKRRVRITRPRLLMEDESRVRGLLIGPRRSRVEWTETESVELGDGVIRLKTKDGRTVEIGKGGEETELEKLFHRIEQVRLAPE